MSSSPAQPIDLNAVYPCPCCRRGDLRLIALTEALGCDRCQKIFVVQGNGHTLEQLSTTYPHQRTWQWNGRHWHLVNTTLPQSPLVLGVTLSLSLAVVMLLMRGLMFWPAVVLLALSGFLVMLWLAYRR